MSVCRLLQGVCCRWLGDVVRQGAPRVPRIAQLCPAVLASNRRGASSRNLGQLSAACPHFAQGSNTRFRHSQSARAVLLMCGRCSGGVEGLRGCVGGCRGYDACCHLPACLPYTHKAHQLYYPPSLPPSSDPQLHTLSTASAQQLTTPRPQNYANHGL